MGSSQSRGRQQKAITVNHPRFQNTKTISNGNLTLMETTINTDQKAYDKWISSMNQKQMNPNKYRFLLLPAEQSKLDKGVCGGCCSNRKTFTITYDNCPYVLTDVIDSYVHKRTAFTEPEMWHLLYALCAAQYEYASLTGNRNSKIGDIRPQNVFISQKGKIKVANPMSWPGQANSYYKLYDGDVTYLPPEEMDNMRRGIRRTNNSNQNCEQFAIGLTMLSAGILKENSDLYDLKRTTFNTLEANKRMNFWLTRQKFSENLRILIAYLCNFRLSRRWNVPELWKFLGNHRAKIGAHELQGSTITLPDNFRDPVAELSINSPYLQEQELPSEYRHQYYPHYQIEDVLEDKSSVVVEGQQNGESTLMKRKSQQHLNGLAIINEEFSGSDSRPENRKITGSELQRFEQTRVNIDIQDPEKAQLDNTKNSSRDELLLNGSKDSIEQTNGVSLKQIVEETYKKKDIHLTDSYLIDEERRRSSNVVDKAPSDLIKIQEEKPQQSEVRTINKPQPSAVQSPKNSFIKTEQETTPIKQQQSSTRQNEPIRATPRPQGTFASPQHQTNSRIQTKYGSPQPYVTSPPAKKPNIKFTYGQPSQAAKSNTYKSNVSKASDVKSPSKGQYTQSYADTKSKGTTSYANQISTSRGSRGSKATDEANKDIHDPYSPSYKPNISKGSNAFAKKPTLNESEAKSPNRNQYIESSVTDYKGPQSQNYSKAQEKIINKVFEDGNNTSSPTVPPPQQKTISEVSHIGSDPNYTKKEEKIINSVFENDRTDPNSPVPSQNVINDVSHIGSDPKYTKKEQMIIQTIFDKGKKQEAVHDPYSPNYKPNKSKLHDSSVKKAEENTRIISKESEDFFKKKDSNKSKSSQSSSSRRTGGNKKSTKDPNMNTITEEKYKKGVTSAQDVNKPTNDTNKTGDRRSSLYSPTFSSRQKGQVVSPKTKDVVHEHSKQPYHKNQGECKNESHHHGLHASQATHLKSNVGLPTADRNCGESKIKTVRQVQPTIVRRKGQSTSERQANILVNKEGEKEIESTVSKQPKYVKQKQEEKNRQIQAQVVPQQVPTVVPQHQEQVVVPEKQEVTVVIPPVQKNPAVVPSPAQEPEIIIPQRDTPVISDHIVEDKQELPKSDQFGAAHPSDMIVAHEVIKQIGGASDRSHSETNQRDYEVVEEPKYEKFNITDPEVYQEYKPFTIAEEKKIDTINQNNKRGVIVVDQVFEQITKKEDIVQPEVKHEQPISIDREIKHEQVVIQTEVRHDQPVVEPSHQEPIIQHQIKPEQPLIQPQVKQEEPEVHQEVPQVQPEIKQQEHIAPASEDRHEEPAVVEPEMKKQEIIAQVNREEPVIVEQIKHEKPAIEEPEIKHEQPKVVEPEIKHEEVVIVEPEIKHEQPKVVEPEIKHEEVVIVEQAKHQQDVFVDPTVKPQQPEHKHQEVVVPAPQQQKQDSLLINQDPKQEQKKESLLIEPETKQYEQKKQSLLIEPEDKQHEEKKQSLLIETELKQDEPTIVKPKVSDQHVQQNVQQVSDYVQTHQPEVPKQIVEPTILQPQNLPEVQTKPQVEPLSVKITETIVEQIKQTEIKIKPHVEPVQANIPIKLHQKKVIIKPDRPEPQLIPPHNYSPPVRNIIKITEQVVKPSGSAISSSKVEPTKKYTPPAKVTPQEKKQSPSKSIKSKPRSDIDLLSQPKNSKIGQSKSVASNTSQNKKSNLSPSKLKQEGQYNLKLVQNAPPSSSQSIQLSYAVGEFDRVWKSPVKKPESNIGFTKYSRPDVERDSKISRENDKRSQQRSKQPSKPSPTKVNELAINTPQKAAEPSQPKSTATIERKQPRYPYRNNDLLDDIVGGNKSVNRASKPQAEVKAPIEKKEELKSTPSVSADRKLFQRKPQRDDILDQVIRTNKDIKNSKQNIGVNASKISKESKSAPKSRIVDQPDRQDNMGGISIVKHLVKSSHNDMRESQMRENSFISKSEYTEGGVHKIRRKSRKHFDFQHDDKIDFHFIHDVNADARSKKSLEKEGVHYIKNPTESGGDLRHIQEEIKHLSGLGTDGHIQRIFKDRHELRHGDGKSSIKPVSEQLLHDPQPVQVIRHSHLMVTERNGSKLRTTSQKFEIPGKQFRGMSTGRTPRLTEKFQSPTKTKQIVEEQVESSPRKTPVESKKLDEKKQPESKVNERKPITRKPRGAYDPIDDLLGFGRPKRSPAPEPVQQKKKQQYVPKKKDTFLQQVKETNKVVNQNKQKQ